MIIVALTVFFKSGSTNGRLLIYKVIVDGISKENFPWWSGVGRFEAWYNLVQARYFAVRELDTNEALLADNTFFAFNDYLQLFVEKGIPGIVVIVVILSLYGRIALRYFLTRKNNYYLTGAHLSLISLLMAAVFYYPFRIPAVYPLVFVSVGIVMMNSVFAKQLTERVYRTFLAGYILLSVVISLTYCVKEIAKAERKLQAEALVGAGFLHKAANSYEQIIAKGFVDADILYSAASVRLAIRDYQHMQPLLQRAAQYRASEKLSGLRGEYYEVTGNLIAAEAAFLEAVFMNPKSFRNRLRLFDFYLNSGQIDKARNWGTQTLKLKEKVPSEASKAIKFQISNKLYERALLQYRLGS